MAHTLPTSSAATPRETLATVRVAPAKAELRPQEAARRLRDIAKETIQRLGKQGAAASDIGIHEGRLSHKLSDGTLSLAELEKLDATYVVAFAEEVLRELGPLSTPQARARQLIREQRRITDELDQLLEYVG